MRASVLSRRIIGVSWALLAVACDSSTGNDGNFTISLTQAATSVAQGANASLTVNITRADFDGPVTLTADGVPAGVSAAFTPPSVTGNSAILLLSAVGSATPGTSTITVRANSEGKPEQTATLEVTVTVTGTFTLAALEPSITIAQGGGANTAVLVNRIGGFGGTVGVSITGAPSGLTVTPGGTSTTGNSLPLTLAADGSLAVGSYTLTATGTSGGLADQQTTLSLNVIAALPTASLTISFCTAPVWFAYRNEGSAWQATTASTSITFQATERLAVAFTFTSPSGGNKQTEVWHATRADLAIFDGSDCSGAKTVNGTVAGLAAGQVAEVIMYTAAANPRPTATAPTYSLSSLPDRPLDLVATSGTAGTGFFTPDKVILRPDLNPAGGATLPVLDFGTAEAFSLAQHTVTINNVTASDEKAMVTTYRTENGSLGRLQFAALATGSGVFRAVPAAQQSAGDVHEMFLDAYQGSAGVGRTLFSYFTTPGDRTETMGPFLNVPILTSLATTPYVRLRARLDSQTEYDTMVRYTFFQGLSSADTRLVYVFLTAGYNGGTTPAIWDGIIPDFSGVTGFNANWMLTQGQPFEWDVWGYGARVALLFGAPPVAGDLIRRSDRAFQSSGAALRATRAAPVVEPFGRRQYFRR